MLGGNEVANEQGGNVRRRINRGERNVEINGVLAGDDVVAIGPRTRGARLEVKMVAGLGREPLRVASSRST